MKEINFYFHIPYCKAKCRFCSFYVIPGRKTRLDDYFLALHKEILSYKETLNNYNIKTIYVGGGTPSLVDSHYVSSTIQLIKSNFNVNSDCEVSVETNPETITEEKIKDYINAGVNRISIGLQSTNNQTLKFLGRLYTFEEFKEKYSIVKSLKFNNVNLDLIFGIPNQSIEEWEESLVDTIELNPNHISTYSLEIDEDSIFGYLEKKGRFKRADESIDRKMYRLSKKILNQHNYNQYEISNFAKSGFECRHNQNIWNGEDYIGFGASSHSRFNSTRFNNINSLEKYIELINTNQDTKENIIQLTEADLLNERILLNLRTTKGINVLKVNNDFRIDFIKNYESELSELSKLKLVEINNNYISLTPKGQDLENFVDLKLIN